MNSLIYVLDPEHFNPEPLKVSFYSDIFSHGSGLASSSAYVISLIKAMSVLENKRMPVYDICKLALDIERNFNPLTGRQDTFGCGIGGLKRMEFFKESNTIARPLDDSIFSNFDMLKLSLLEKILHSRRNAIHFSSIFLKKLATFEAKVLFVCLRIKLSAVRIETVARRKNCLLPA